MEGAELDLSIVNGPIRSDSGIAHGRELVAFTDAVMGRDEAALARRREALRSVLPEASFVDVAATIAAFNVVDRVADATGIPLDPILEAMSSEVRRELDLARFPSAANTPGSNA